jgi:Uma2 family endonuclease
LPADNGYQCFPHRPGLVRRPDVSFVRYGRLPGEVLPKGWIKIPPDLAVEVVSPNDGADELDEELEDYQDVGVPLIWVIYPQSRTVTVYRDDGSVSRLRESDELSGEDVIPGFRCAVRELFPPRQLVPENGQPTATGSVPTDEDVS